MMIQHVATTLVLAAGIFFLMVAAFGFLRLPDVFCRLHVMGVIDTLGAPLILLGAAIYLGPQLTAGKLVLGLAFIAITSPLVGHLLARAALEAGHQPGVIENPAEVPPRFERQAQPERFGAGEAGEAALREKVRV
jgi:multicomponent Na+:H+ antiporter subunit G